jgi:hypothetical protein
MQQAKNSGFKYFKYEGADKTKKLQVTSNRINIAGQNVVVTAIRDLSKWA